MRFNREATEVKTIPVWVSVEVKRLPVAIAMPNVSDREIAARMPAQSVESAVRETRREKAEAAREKHPGEEPGPAPETAARPGVAETATATVLASPTMIVAKMPVPSVDTTAEFQRECVPFVLPFPFVGSAVEPFPRTLPLPFPVDPFTSVPQADTREA